jgi:hypothetical protein
MVCEKFCSVFSNEGDRLALHIQKSVKVRLEEHETPRPCGTLFILLQPYAISILNYQPRRRAKGLTYRHSGVD